MKAIFQHITDLQFDQFSEQKFLILDHFFDPDFAKIFKQDLQQIFQYDPTWFRHAGISRHQEHHLNLNVRDDRMTWLDEDLIEKCKAHGLDEEADTLRDFDQAVQAFKQVLNEQLWLSLKSYEIQLAVYQSNSQGYQAHLDSFKGRQNRMLSCVWYLNEDWTALDGGALFLPEHDLEVLPIFNRLILFQSEEVLHGVRPNGQKERWAVAIWFRMQAQ
jgi:SM-20-related protein